MSVRQAVIDRFIGDIARDLDAEHAPAVSSAYADAMRRTDAAFDALEARLAAPVRVHSNGWLIAMLIAAPAMAALAGVVR